MSDVIIKYSTPAYRGSMTFVPGEMVLVDQGPAIYPPGDSGKRTLEFDLREGQYLPIEIREMRIRLLVYRDRFEVEKLKERREVLC